MNIGDAGIAVDARQRQFSRADLREAAAACYRSGEAASVRMIECENTCVGNAAYD